MKDKLLTLSFMITICAMMLIAVFSPDQTLSVSERRKLAQLPAWDQKAFMSSEYMDEWERYVADQFPFRDAFRKLKGYVAQQVFQMKDEDGIFVYNQAIYKLHPSLNEISIRHFTTLLNDIHQRYLSSSHLYFALIPDKVSLLEANIPKWDDAQLNTLLTQQLKDVTFIDLSDTLTLHSYYSTDLHWRQETLSAVMDKLTAAMNLPDLQMPTEKHCYDDFYGAYYGRIAHHLKKDTLCYLSNDVIQDALVYDFEKQRNRKVYEQEDLTHMDAYDIFLGGAKPLLIIENKHQNNQRELILFRDSFGSSLAPLLIPHYAKITMIDLRYLSSDMLEKITEIDLDRPQADVLFLYSASMVNQSDTMK